MNSTKEIIKNSLNCQQLTHQSYAYDSIARPSTWRQCFKERPKHISSRDDTLVTLALCFINEKQIKTVAIQDSTSPKIFDLEKLVFYSY